MAKTLYFNIPADGHVNPSLGVLAELVRRGETVVAFNMESYRTKMEATGASFRAYPVVPALTRVTAAGDSIPQNALTLWKACEEILPFVFETLEREQPDYVIFDSLASWGQLAATKLGLPTIGSITTFVMDPRMMSGVLPPLQTASTYAEILWRALPYWPIAARLRRRYGVSPGGFMSTFTNTGQLNLVYTSREFQPQAEVFDSRYKFVGPSITPRPVSDAFTRDGNSPSLIYISLGTIKNQNLDFYRECFAAFVDFPGKVLLSAGKQTDLGALGTPPANFDVRNFVPQLEVLEVCDLFITHGGMNSVHEGLWYGVPLVVVPQQIEQRLVAKRVAESGAGLALLDRIVMAAALRTTADRVLGSPNYREAAQRLGDTLRAAGGYTRAVGEIFAFTGR